MDESEEIFNWGILHPTFTGIQIHLIGDDEFDAYQSSIVLFLGEEETVANLDSGVVVVTNIISDSVEDCVLETLVSLDHLFGNVMRTALVLDENGNFIEKVDISDIVAEHKKKTSSDQLLKMNYSKTIH